MEREITDIIDIFNDSPIDIVTKMSQGNPGACGVLAQLITTSPSMDPDNAFEGFGPLIMLDTLGIYGSEIWILFKDICNQDVRKVIVLLRAIQLGFQSRLEVYDIIDSHGAQKLSKSFETLNNEVCNFLPAFKGI